MMTHDMLGVLNQVAGNYTDTIKNVKNPTSNPATTPPPLSPAAAHLPAAERERDAASQLRHGPAARHHRQWKRQRREHPELQHRPAARCHGHWRSRRQRSAEGFRGLAPPGTGTAGGLGGLGANGLPNNFATSPAPGLNSVGGLGGLNGAGTPSNFATSPAPGLGGLNGTGTPNDFAVSPAPGLGTASGLGGLGGLPVSPFSLASAPSGSSSKLGALNPAMDAALNPTTAGCRPVGPAEHDRLGALKEAGLPLSSELAAPPALESSVPGAGGMPMMPSSGAGMPQKPRLGALGRLGPAVPGRQGVDRRGRPGGEVGSLKGVGSGGVGLSGTGLNGTGLNSTGLNGTGLNSTGLSGETLAAAPGVTAGAPGSGGMPMMPGSGAGGMPQNQSSERSDASGLLSGESKPWTGESAPLPDEVSSASGAASGGVGLSGEGLNGTGLNGETLAAAPGVTAGRRVRAGCR